MFNIILCGCGNIGFRHLQAIGRIGTPTKVYVVEPNQETHHRIEELKLANLELSTQLPTPSRKFDLAVIATTAGVRRQVYEALTKEHKVRSIIFEKVAFQSLADINFVEADLNDKDIRAYVNCGRRGFPDYQKLSKSLDNAQPTNVTVRGSNFGLASNAIHFLDLAEFLNSSQISNLDLSGLNPNPKHSKRSGNIEVFGEIEGTLRNGARFIIDCQPGNEISLEIRLENDQSISEISELGRKIVTDGETRVFDTKFVSEMTYLYEKVLLNGLTDLTPYGASARQHRHLITQMNKYLGLDENQGTVCPIS